MPNQFQTLFFAMKPDFQNLKINNPCLMLLSRMNKVNNNYSCNSCNKIVIDFRHKTLEEIQDILKSGTCGIFNTHQLPAQQKMSFARKTIFYGLTLLAFLGFAVNPVKAQSPQNITPVKDSVSVDIENPKSKEEPNTEIKPEVAPTKKHFFRKNKKPRVIMGCPDF
jgi:hypothetical protein